MLTTNYTPPSKVYSIIYYVRIGCHGLYCRGGMYSLRYWKITEKGPEDVQTYIFDNCGEKIIQLGCIFLTLEEV